MSFKREAAAALVGAAVLAAMGSAQADTLPVTAGHAFYFSGSTAMDNPVKALFLHTGAVCAAGADVYTDAALNATASATITKGHNTVVACKLNQAIGSGTGSLPVGTLVAFDKESNGGSLEGSIPVARGTSLAFFNLLVAPTCAGTASIAAGASYSSQEAYTLHYGCTVNGSGIHPDIGVADENLEVFNVGNPTITKSDISNLTVNQFAQNIFGVAMSLNGYRALQRSQGLALDDTIAHMPTLTTAQIRAIYTGQAQSWANITDSAGRALNNTANTGGVTVASQVYVCRRGDSSGTNSAMDIRFIGNRCVDSNISATQSMVAVTSTLCTAAIGTAQEYGCTWAAGNLGDTVFAGFGGGDVAACLNAHDGANQFAIGNLTTNQAFDDLNGLGGSADTAGTNKFRYVKIDGHSPDAGNVVNGGYDFVFDNVLTYNTNTASVAVVGLVNSLLTDWTSSGSLVGSLLTTQIGDTNFTAGALEDQLNPLGSAAANTSPPYVTGAAVKSGAGGVTPVSPWTFLAVNTSVPQNCAPAAALPNPGVAP